jgi:hypothetical protein
VLTVKEKDIPFLNLSSYVQASTAPIGSGGAAQHAHSANGSNAVGVEIQAALRSPTGNGETLSVSVSGAQSGSQDIAASLTIPAVGSLSPSPFGPLRRWMQSTSNPNQAPMQRIEVENKKSCALCPQVLCCCYW